MKLWRFNGNIFLKPFSWKQVGKIFHFCQCVLARGYCFHNGVCRWQSIRRKKKIDLVVYETLKTEVAIQTSDFEIFLFTSPSNVEAFFEKNKLNASQKVIAMGEATASSLKKSGILHPALPDAFDDVALTRAVFNASSL